MKSCWSCLVEAANESLVLPTVLGMVAVEEPFPFFEADEQPEMASAKTATIIVFMSGTPAGQVYVLVPTRLSRSRHFPPSASSLAKSMPYQPRDLQAGILVVTIVVMTGNVVRGSMRLSSGDFSGRGVSASTQPPEDLDLAGKGSDDIVGEQIDVAPQEIGVPEMVQDDLDAVVRQTSVYVQKRPVRISW